jgi:sugar lactone lactonase YvrE
MRHQNHSLLFITVSFLLAACGSPAQTGLPERYLIFTLIAGDGRVDNIPARDAYLRGPWRIAVGSDGTVYFGESFSFTIRKITPDGIVTPVAGNAIVGSDGDGGPALGAKIGADIPGLALDSRGNLYFGDANFTVRRVDTNGTITRFAGTGQSGFSGDGGPASAAQLGAINGIAMDSHDDLFISTADNRLRRVTPDGMIQTIAGTGQAAHSGDGGVAVKASLDRPSVLAADAQGNLYVAEGSFRIRRVSPDGLITTVAGNGTYGFSAENVSALSAKLGQLTSLATAPDGSLYFGERTPDPLATPFTRVRRLTLDGKLVTVAAGRGPGYNDSGIPALDAGAGLITGLAFDTAGNLYFSDLYNHLINRVDTAGMLTIVGGRPRFAGDGGPAYHAVTAFLTGIAADSNGNVYVGDAWNRRIRRIDSTLTISTFAGNGIFGDYGDGLPAEGASLGWTNQMLSLADGSLLVADYGSNRIRRIDSLGMITTIAGTGQPGSGGDGGPAVNAQLNNPFGVAMDSSGNIYVSEVTGNRVRKITLDGKISTIAGNGTPGYSGDGGPARDAQVNGPRSLALDASGNLYIADFSNLRIRRISPDGTITTFAGNGKSGWTGDGGLATAASINAPLGLLFDPFGALLFTSNTALGAVSRGGLVRRVRPGGTIDTIAGNGNPGDDGDGGYATDATLNFPDSLAIDSAGRILVTDRFNQRVRALIPAQ